VTEARIRSALDVVVRAFGESVTPAGAFSGSPCTPGIELNVATGIAAAIVERSGPMMSHPVLGETYGQWGRYLFLDPRHRLWQWIPTENGSIPEHDPSLVRFTDRCGGPALARRFIAEWRNRFTPGEPTPSVLKEMLERFPKSAEDRDVELEKRVLSLITQRMHNGDPIATAFGLAAAREIGSALQCAIHALSLDVKKIVIAGGVGENFALPRHGHPDEFLRVVRGELAGAVEVCRSEISLDAEFLGFAGPRLSQ